MSRSARFRSRLCLWLRLDRRFCHRVLVPLWRCSVLCHHQQPVQLGDAPYRATILLVKFVRLCPEGPWSCCVTMGACRLSVVPFQGNPRILVSSEVTYLPLIGSRCADLAFRSRPPRFHVTTSDQDSRGNTRVLVHHPFCERKHLRCVRLPKDSHERLSDIIFHLESRHAPGCLTYQRSQLDCHPTAFLLSVPRVTATSPCTRR